jgi:hypothetical protein
MGRCLGRFAPLQTVARLEALGASEGLLNIVDHKGGTLSGVSRRSPVEGILRWLPPNLMQ